MKRAIAIFALLIGVETCAEQVHVTREVVLDSVTNTIDVEVRMTGVPYTTGLAQTIDGYVFTHWSISTRQEFVDRDEWGRACDEVGFVLYEDTVLSAHYLPLAEDADQDGIPDGYELYYYGDLSQDGESDTDEDGRPFREELEIGTSPLNAEDERDGYVRLVDGGVCAYNPRGYKSITIMSRPEGELLTTSVEYLRPDTWVDVAAFSPQTSKFAYWERNGVRVCDEWGRAIDGCGFMMSTNDECFIAVLADDETARMKLYWYGTTDISMESDTDGDGVVFADELLRGTSPLEFDEDVQGPVRTADGALLQFNPYNKHSYLVRSEPEGVLFETISNYVSTGLFVESPRCDGLNGVFAFWTLNGEEVRDEWGRAMDVMSFQMPTVAVELVAHVISNETERAKYYWYGTFDVSMDSDTDDDGVAFAAELANGTDPIIADEFVQGPIAYADSAMHETNLQPYEQLRGAVVENKFRHLFTSPIVGDAEISETFFDGVAIQPVVADVNGDGLWDIVVAKVGSGEYKVYLNCGTKGSPKFEEKSGLEITLPSELDLAMNSTEKLDTLNLDTPVVGALSATVWGDILLASDADGRIWFYRGTVARPGSAPGQNVESEGSTVSMSYTLQHKVWGGSYAGFANGLRLAAVDWDEDGDLDCLCGTAEGRLMLLRDPKVGRPTNVKAVVGVDNVLLMWDPNAQSRIRGYRVYRSSAGEDAPVPGVLVAEPTIPRHRDYPEEIAACDYKVSSVSRHYVSGNSTPIESESLATEAVRAELGKVAFRWGDAVGYEGEEIFVALSVENSLNLSAKGLALEVGYDSTMLTPVRVETSGLTEDVVFLQSAVGGVWRITAEDGEIAVGGGALMTLVFRAGYMSGSVAEGVDGKVETSVALLNAVLKSVKGTAVATVLPSVNAAVTVERRGETPLPCFGRGDVNGDGRLTKEDTQLMAQLMQGKEKWNADQLRAGDYNDDGRLDNNDYQLMRADFRAKGVL